MHCKVTSSLLTALVITLASSCSTASAGVILQTIESVAIQNVNLVGIETQLVTPGTLSYVFDLGPDGTTATGGGNSRVRGFYQGNLPDAFTPLGLAGLPYDLSNDDSVFPIPREKLEVFSDGTVRIESHFGLQVFDPTRAVVRASFNTQEPGIFQAAGIGVPIPGGSILGDPNRPNDVLEIYQNDEALVGVSFNRVVTTVPEPSSLAILGIGLFGLTAGAVRGRRKRLAA